MSERQIHTGCHAATDDINNKPYQQLCQRGVRQCIAIWPCNESPSRRLVRYACIGENPLRKGYIETIPYQKPRISDVILGVFLIMESFSSKVQKIFFIQSAKNYCTLEKKLPSENIRYGIRIYNLFSIQVCKFKSDKRNTGCSP